MPAKPLTIGNRDFPRQMDALNFFKEMLGRYRIGERVSPADSADLEALLNRHQDVESKLGCGISHFKVDKDGYAGRCFWVVRTDGTQDDFTYKRCVTGIW
ncbi:hypothetical protein CMZ84_05845 [Lysobacteraceae bacterium NML93-0399]|nr:hypothetical protein CMZ84_05845 [Xanthomonadaceae bacterium NML93-0399]